jgi:HEAT repeat protein
MAASSPSLSHLIDQATAGELEAIQNLLRRLNSANPDLRHMMQAALHAAHNTGLWRRLLFCVGHDCWPATNQKGELVKPVAARLSPAPAENQAAGPRVIQSITEVFVLEAAQAAEGELEVKQAVLLPALEDADPLTRWAAAYLLGLRGNLRAAPVLDEILSSTCRETDCLNVEQCIHWQLRAIQALAGLNDVVCGPPLIKGLASPERTVHHAAGAAINELGRLAEPALLNALHHPDAHVRWHAARALGQIGDPRAVDILAEGLYDDRQDVRWTAARVLAYLDAPAIPSILKVLCAQPVSEPLRQSAYHALNSMACLHTAEISVYMEPLLDALRRQSAISTIAVEAPVIAQRMLAEWKNVAPLYNPPGARREERHIEF